MNAFPKHQYKGNRKHTTGVEEVHAFCTLVGHFCLQVEWDGFDQFVVEKLYVRT